MSSSFPYLPIAFLLNHSNPLSLTQLRHIHALLITSSLNTPPLLSSLIQRYFPQFSSYTHRILTYHYQHHQTPFLLNTLIKSAPPRDSILLFSNWVSKTSPQFDQHTYIFALGACARSASRSGLFEGRQIHGCAVKDGWVMDVQVATTGVHFYASNGDMGCARKVFDEMPVRNVVSWNALLSGYCSRRGECDDVGSAREGLVLFKDMLVGGIWPTETTVLCVLSASSRLGVLESGFCLHGFVEKTVPCPESNVFIGTCLVDMYSKIGYLKSALTVFDRMEEKNVRTWTAMATGLARHGNGKRALELLDEMRACNVMPNVVTFTSLLSACCHAGLVEEGLQLFYMMESKFGIEPNIQHYGCIVDLLGRAGHLEEAYDFVVGLPVEPDPVLWRSLLSSCRMHGDIKMGERVGKVLVHILPSLVDSEAPCQDLVALSNVYAMAGKWTDVGKLRKTIKIKRAALKPGNSVVKSSFN